MKWIISSIFQDGFIRKKDKEIDMLHKRATVKATLFMDARIQELNKNIQ